MKRKLISFVISAFILMVLLPGSFASSESIKWYSFDEGMALGHSEKKRIYINFRADWCVYCKVMEKKTFQNPAVISYLNKYFISIKIDTEKEKEVTNMFRVQALPDNWFLFKNGDRIKVDYRKKGYIPPDPFMKKMKKIIEDIGTKKKD